MIARHPHRIGPIPFSNNALVFQPTSGRSHHGALQACEPERSPWATALAQLANAQKPERPAPHTGHGAAPTPGTHASPSSLKATRARYDGPHALSIRSATSGRHYRFEHPGSEQVIDTIDIALLRRIEGITII